jgi:putative protease
VSHRHYSTGFYYGEPGQYTQSSRYIREWQIVGIVEDCAGDGTAVVSLRNKFRAGDALELVGPDLRPVAFSAPEMTTLEGEPMEEPKTPQMRFRMKLPVQAPPLSILRRQAEGL